MTSITFDTHLFVKRLRDKGVSEPQAEAIVDVIREAREHSLQEAATRADIAQVKADLRETELRLKLHIGSMIMALGGVLIAIKYFG